MHTYHVHTYPRIIHTLCDALASCTFSFARPSLYICASLSLSSLSRSFFLSLSPVVRAVRARGLFTRRYDFCPAAGLLMLLLLLRWHTSRDSISHTRGGTTLVSRGDQLHERKRERKRKVHRSLARSPSSFSSLSLSRSLCEWVYLPIHLPYTCIQKTGEGKKAATGREKTEFRFSSARIFSSLPPRT